MLIAICYLYFSLALKCVRRSPWSSSHYSYHEQCDLADPCGLSCACIVRMERTAAGPISCKIQRKRNHGNVTLACSAESK